ncbi:MAG: peptidylprolyl isomerase [Bacteroidota bacterium]|nr:peptidylprolyl isomerase [Bacteroidota bacterium]
MMAKMRSLAPAFIITVGAIFVLFMVMSDSNVMQALGGRSNNVGSVNGVNISYQEFSKAIEQQLQLAKQQGQEISEDQMDQFREQVWDSYVQQKLVDQEIKKLGITVSDQEVEDLLFGDNPPQELTRQFTDSTGRFNRSAYVQALKDKRNAAILVQVKDGMKQQMIQRKLQSMLMASVVLNEDQMQTSYKDQTINYNFEYAFVDANIIPDNQVSVNDQDLKTYYEKHQEKYRVKASRKVDFVLFATTPSGEDSAAVKKEITNVYQTIKNDTSNFKSLVEQHSMQPYSKDTIPFTQLTGEAATSLANSSAGALTEPLASQEGYVIYKISSIIPGTSEVAHAEHILINQFGDSAQNYAEAMKVYNELVNGGNFEKIAKEKSGDKGSAVQGGDLGWFSKGRMVPEFENAVFSGSVGQVLKPIKTQFGYHIIKVLAKTTDKKFVVERIISPVKASLNTRDNAQNNAKDFGYVAANKGGLEAEAKIMNYSVHQSASFLKDAQYIPGLGVNKRLIEWAFDNKVGKVNEEPFRVQGGYAIIKVNEVVNDGIEPFEKVKDQIKPFVLKAKKMEKAILIANDVKSKINGNLKNAPMVNNKVAYDTTGQFTLAGQNIPKIGRDFVVMDNIKKLSLNSISEPIKGLRGYYIIRMIGRTNFDKNQYDAQRQSLIGGTYQQKMQMFFQEWIKALKKNADIVDKRYMFFGQ